MTPLRGHRHFRKVAWSLVILALVTAIRPVSAQETFWQELTTAERIAKSPWWPTKRATASDKFTGDATCAECHADIAKAQKQSEMARTLLPAKSSAAASFAGKSISVDGFTYKLKNAANDISFDLSSAKPIVSERLGWAFGSGEISQVYFTAHSNYYNESHFSYFKKINGFDVTPAQPRMRDMLRLESKTDDQDIKSAVGRKVSNEEALRCFSCHAANVPMQGGVEAILPGVTCEACHGPGGNHVSAARAGLSQANALIFNPAHLNAVDRVDFCGACHGTSLDVLTEGGSGVSSVRFPAYRLQNSKCWSNDNRIQCTSCHDPHRAIEASAAAYDSRCLSCHLSSASATADAVHKGKACPTATKDCVTCHMPKYDFPDVHHAFTDHQIRVANAGEPAPM